MKFLLLLLVPGLALAQHPARSTASFAAPDEDFVAASLRLVPQLLMGACDTTNYNTLKSSALTGNVYLCTPRGWMLKYTEDDGVLPAANRDVPAHAFIAQNEPGGFGLRMINDGCIDFGSGPSEEICGIDNELWVYSTMRTATLFAAVLAPQTQGAPFRIINVPGWTGEYPINSTPTCDVNAQGGRITLTTDGRSYYCDGTTVERIGFTRSNTASVNFASMASGAEDTQTMSITGAVTTDVVHCTPLGTPESGLVFRYFQVSAPGVVSISAQNFSGGTLDPASLSMKCIVTR